MNKTPTGSDTGRRVARRVASWLLVAAWAGVIFWFSTKPGSQIPSGYSEQGHLGEYLIFGVLLYAAVRADMTRSQAVSIAIIAASLYGMTDEFHQHFVAMRTPDVVDWGVDTIGATLGALLALAASRAIAARRRKTPRPASSAHTVRLPQ
jgi:hypothetical protein